MEWILSTPKGLLADEAGLGKTPQALTAISKLLAADALNGGSAAADARTLARVLWVTDAALIRQTAVEAARFAPELSVLTGLDPELRTGERAQRRMEQNYPSGVDVLILSYETVNSRRRWLEDLSFGMLVLDEASNVKGGGKQFQATRALAVRTPRVLSMTATPIENDPTELWTILSATDAPGLWAKSAFDQGFVRWRVGWVDQWGKERRVADGWREDRLHEVRRYLPTVALRRTHDQVGSVRPKRIDAPPIEVALTPAQQAAYEAASRATTRDAVRRMEAAALLGGPNPPIAEALLAELGRRDEPAIVYCETLEMLGVVEEQLRNRGVTTVRIEGKVDAAGRQAAIEAHRDRSARVLLASKVLEYGLNLQHCRLLISLDTSWTRARERQREGRICRLGSPHETFEHIVIRPATSLSAAKAARLDKKHRMAELVGLA